MSIPKQNLARNMIIYCVFRKYCYIQITIVAKICENSISVATLIRSYLDEKYRVKIAVAIRLLETVEYLQSIESTVDHSDKQKRQIGRNEIDTVYLLIFDM